MIATELRLNLGSGNYPIDGWTNVDAFTEADVQGDLFDLEFTDVLEVRMSHVLEHLPWRRVPEALERIHGWMIPDDGVLVVEVPDMDAIMARGTAHPLWFKYVYGDQSHGGEYHLSGWTEPMLRAALDAAGWHVAGSRLFESDHKGREGMPCIEAVATA